jgi:hypothetical protein
MRLRRQTDTGMGEGHGKEVEGKMLHAAEFGKKKEVKLEEAFLVQSPTPQSDKMPLRLRTNG